VTTNLIAGEGTERIKEQKKESCGEKLERRKREEGYVMDLKIMVKEIERKSGRVCESVRVISNNFGNQKGENIEKRG
jgi:hypothetical protein